MMAMSRCHSALLANQWTGVQLDRLIADELRAHEDRVDIEGPPVTVNGSSAQTMTLIIHELATNAAKHGALSNERGRVRVEWQRTAGDRIRLSWEENGGPKAAPPERTGFGHSILVQVADHEFSASPEISFASDGLKYAVEFPG
jgi:two-component sensor histidine kinase